MPTTQLLDNNTFTFFFQQQEPTPSSLQSQNKVKYILFTQHICDLICASFFFQEFLILCKSFAEKILVII